MDAAVRSHASDPQFDHSRQCLQRTSRAGRCPAHSRDRRVRRRGTDSLWYDAPLSIKAFGLLVAFVIAVISPVAAIGARMAATPFIYDPIDLSGREFSLLELAILVGGAGIAFNALWSMVSTVRQGSIRLVLPWPMTIGIVVLMLAAGVSLITFADERYRPESLRAFRLVIVEPLLFFAACRWVLVDTRARRFASFILVGVGAAVGAFAVGQVVFGSEGVMADGVRRATGPYPHPNNLALFLERAGLLGAGYALAGRRSIAGLECCGGGIIGVGVTFSRGVRARGPGRATARALVQKRLRGIWYGRCRGGRCPGIPAGDGR